MELPLGTVFVAGLLTFVSPCVLPLVPVYLGILAGSAEEDRGRFRALIASGLFVAGFILVFALLGLSATAVGGLLARNRLVFQQVGGVVILLLGLRFMGYLRLPFFEGLSAGGLGRWKTRFHYLNSLLLGLLFAFAWTPCIGSVLGAVLTYTALTTSDAWTGMGYLTVYGLGFGLPLVAVAAAAGPALALVRRARRFLPVFEKVTGVLLVAVGFLLVTDRLGIIDSALSRPMEPAAVAVPTRTAPPAAGATCGPESGAACGATEEASTPQLIEFFSPDCSICRQMIPAFGALQSDCRDKSVRITQVDVTSPEGKLLAQRFGVRGIPVFVYLDASGNEVARLVGYQSLASLQQAMAVLIGEACPGYREVPGLKAPRQKRG